MLELVSVEMENFRAFTSARFTPARAGEGLTAIVGENGSGKSSIVTAILFCLYGITPEGVTISGLRKQDTTEPVVVRTTMLHNNQTLIVERSIRGTTDKTTAKIILNGEEQTDISSRIATQWIVRETGLNAESFTSAFVVKQKELDSLVKARPAERRKTIERLAGVERMSKAITYAREELKIKKVALDNTNTSNFDLGEIQNRINELEQSNIKLGEENEQDKNTLEELTKKKETLEEEITIVKGLLNDNKETTHQEELKKQKLDTIQNSIEKNVKTIEESMVDGKLANIETLEIQLENISEEINKLESTKTLHDETARQLTLLTEEIAQIHTAIEQFRTVTSQLVEEKTQAENELGAFNDTTLDSEETELLHNSDKIKADIAILTNDIKIGEETLKVFNAHTTHTSQTGADDITCPTCHHPIEDVRTLEEDLKNNIHNKKETLAEKNYTHEQVLTQLEQVRLKKTERTTIVTRIQQLEQKITQAEEKLVDKSEELRKKEQLRTQLESNLNNSALLVEEYSVKMKNLNTAFKEYNEKIVQIENATHALQENEQLVYEHTQIVEQLSVLHDRKHNNEETLKKYDNPKVLETQKEQYIQSIIECDKRINNRDNRIQMQTNDILNEEKLKTHATTTQERVEGLKKDIEILETTIAALSEFRKDRLARLSPELSEITSDLLAEMTNGKYTTVEFDEDFTPYITNDIGETRPVTWLSGGEESLVALALRVGVGEILAGGRNGNLLVLDEVLTAQDKNRRAATLGSLRNLNRQTIVINHIEEATDIADKIVYVTQPEEGNEHEGSQLTAAV